MTDFFNFLYNEFINTDNDEVKEILTSVAQCAMENLDFRYDYDESYGLMITGAMITNTTIYEAD